ncbi:ligase-associated DNA damage response endonuclease PdeM [Ottowia sp.]|uniref:ligase-associated DNA damage response endonuclease PdeM n=1 Tax=Ottowia sp. TaxID=1898956 RepID=UPI001D99D4A7|nr:ligase-associated DNA damage response endonuclease PdeM [Ottowia sp.]MCB2026855.1 ligase-associated DNA damage response endonuclease PdeM [Ottowia sp.]MCB2032409.1 ligase-associated DNA damage response endonuclease PdeM [Ottowia sp.]MCP5258113.1 ligase-associated DNA damage response endonuclease PdeM [Burkholderiaceae bacterium]HRW72290.1 ligase-associated DNA damage response endonuclease PdeM [Ottowia sp.]
MNPLATPPSPAGATALLPGAVALRLPGAVLHLLPHCAAWWPDAGVLFVADLHLGKAAVFRARGLPVPEATTTDTLDRLSEALRTTGAGRLVLLGDFLHAREARQPPVLAALAGWRARHAALDVVLVRGNHDRHAGDPPAALGLALVDEPWTLGPLAACHHPQHAPGRTVLAGHAHPVVHLQGPGRDRLRLPCFHLGPGQLILPAFGAFTGGQAMRPAAGAVVYAVGAGRVWRAGG